MIFLEKLKVFFKLQIGVNFLDVINTFCFLLLVAVINVIHQKSVFALKAVSSEMSKIISIDTLALL
jgi:hypothetical protein